MLYPIELGVQNSLSSVAIARRGLALALAVDDRKPHMFGLWPDRLVYEISADNPGGIPPRYFRLGAPPGARR